MYIVFIFKEVKYLQVFNFIIIYIIIPDFCNILILNL